MNVILRKMATACRVARRKVSSRVTHWRCRKNLPGYYGIDGFLSEAEGMALYDVAGRLRKEAVILEIGSWQGKSTYCLARGLAEGKIIVIDPFNGDAGDDENSGRLYGKLLEEKQCDLFDRFQENMKRCGLTSKIEVRRGFSHEFVKEVPPLDVLFIDGDHSIKGCSFDYGAYGQKVVPGGYLLFHDYDPARREMGPTHVIEQMVLPSGKYSQTAVIDSLWIGRRSRPDVE
jgi:hypothetical protein